MVSDKLCFAIDLVENGKNGYVFELGRKDDFSKKLNLFEDKYIGFGKKSEEIIKYWSFGNIADAIEESFADTIKSVFQSAETQICVVHQIRNSARYVVWKDKKEFTKDMRYIYTATNRDAAQAALGDFKKKWNEKYSYAIDAWCRNWDELTVFLDFPVKSEKSFILLILLKT